MEYETKDGTPPFAAMPNGVVLAVREIADGVAQLKAKQGQHLNDLQDRIEELESKRMLPGKAPLPPTTPEGWRTGDGEPLPIMTKGFDFARAYADREHAGLTLADFARAVAGMKTTDIARKALSVGTGSAGGYAVPTVLMPGILEAMTPASALLQAGAGIVDVSMRDGKTFDFAGVDTVPAAAWRSEAGAVAEADPAFRVVTTTPRSLSFYFKVSRELLADAPNMEQALRTAIAQAFAKELDRTGLRGSGSAPEPKGLLGTTGVNSVSNGAAGASLATTAYANFMSAVQLILEDDAPMPTAAIMSPRSLVVLGGLLDTTNQPRAAPEVLRQVRMLATSQIPNNLTVGGSVDCSEIYIGDFSKVAFVLREQPSILLADQAFATNGQVGFICHARADVAVLYPKAFATVTGVRP